MVAQSPVYEDKIVNRKNALTKTSDGLDAWRVVVSDVPAKAESWKYDWTATVTAGAFAEETGDVSLYCPFDSLTFTKSAGANDVTVTLRLRPNSDGILVVADLSGGETIAITGTINGVATEGVFVRAVAAGGLAVSSALANGTYQLVF